MPTSPEQTGRKILSGPQVARKCGVSNRSLFAWPHDPRLDFPAGMPINNKWYFYEEEIDAWLLERAKDGIARKKAIIAAAEYEAA